jgi:hypothetical protein
MPLFQSACSKAVLLIDRQVDKVYWKTGYLPKVVPFIIMSPPQLTVLGSLSGGWDGTFRVSSLLPERPLQTKNRGLTFQ